MRSPRRYRGQHGRRDQAEGALDVESGGRPCEQIQRGNDQAVPIVLLAIDNTLLSLHQSLRW